MRRRTFAAALGIACLPAGLRAQPQSRLYRVGWLDYSSSAENLGVFAQAMGARGWVDGKSFRIDYRGGEGRAERLAAVAAELAKAPVDIIVAPGPPEAHAARKATATVPIVMSAVDDPVAAGLVASLARPGGNVTGLASARRELSAKLLALLRELLPRATSAAMLYDADDADHKVILAHLQGAAKASGIALHPVPVSRAADIEPAFAGIRKQGNGMVIVSASALLVPRWIADLALKNGLPLASVSPAYVYEGGLIALSDDWNAVYERVATYVDRILRGAKPADLPVELPTKFKLVINARSAQQLGLALSPAVLVRADHVIE
jgi:putative ABC transport system substrate-binding protein